MEQAVSETYDYSQFQEPVSSNILAVISGLAREQAAAELEVAKAEDALKAANEALRAIREVRLPSLLQEAKVTECTTTDGVKVKLKETIRGSITKAKQEGAFKWLLENGHGALIKRVFEIKFNKDEEAWADKFQRDLAQRKKPVRAEIKRSVHPQTLAAFVAEELGKGKDIPMETLGVFQQKISDIEFEEDKLFPERQEPGRT